MHLDRRICDLVCEASALLAGYEHALPAVVTDHVATCLRCQASQARYRRTSSELRGLRAQPVAPPAGALAATIAALHAAPDLRPAPHLSSGVVATATGAAAGVAGIVVWYQRRRALAG